MEQLCKKIDYLENKEGSADRYFERINFRQDQVVNAIEAHGSMFNIYMCVIK